MLFYEGLSSCMIWKYDRKRWQWIRKYDWAPKACLYACRTLNLTRLSRYRLPMLPDVCGVIGILDNHWITQDGPNDVRDISFNLNFCRMRIKRVKWKSRNYPLLDDTDCGEFCWLWEQHIHVIPRAETLRNQCSDLQAAPSTMKELFRMQLRLDY